MSKFRSFFQLLRDSNPPWSLFAGALALSIATTGLGLVAPLLMRSLVDGFSFANLNLREIVLIALAFLGQAAGSALSGYLLVVVGQKTVASLRERIWRKILRLPIAYFDGKSTGDLVSRMNNDAVAIRTLVAENLSGFITGCISLVGSIIFLVILDWHMTVIMLAALPAAAAIIVPLGRVMRKISGSTMEENARFSSIIARVISEMRLVKASNAESYEHARGKGAIGRLFSFGLREGKVQSFISPLMSIVLMAILAIIVGYGGVQVASGALTAGALVAFIMYLVQIVSPLGQISGFITQLQKARGATESIIALFAEPSEPFEGGAPVPVQGAALHFENVSFHYRPEDPVIRDVTFTLEPGSVNALVGPSGAGKTTLVSLVERFYEPKAGAIRIGEQPISELSLQDWRRTIGYVSQDSPLMEGTIRENIVYGLSGEVGDAEVYAAARMANAHDFIAAFPDGYDAPVGERGVKLSGGQRQRIAIARALLRDPELLILDEATSNLDSGSEAAVQDALKTLMRGRTTIVIAHRLSTVVDADQILFLEGGVVTGRGTHAELAASHPVYRAFAERQFHAAALSA